MKRSVVVGALGTAQTLAWGSSYYLPAILADPIAHGLGLSRTIVFGLFSGALLLSAVLGPSVGRAILTALIEAANAAGMHKLTSRVFPENVASRALLKRLGFEEIGIHRRHGKLDGLWRDCVIVERLLDEDLK